ncbi:MAG TPA: hydroxymethylbilane synthase [Vicinamibacterales bacterium]|nr:hydroxymethylbilane synthase [Vicinamibacterales bacterium]
MSSLRLGSRGSHLALFQAGLVAQRIEAAGGPTIEIVVIKTSGDRLQEAPLSEVGGKRVFVKEIEDALLSRDIDLAVHSSKDMPALLPEGLELGAVLEREDSRDALILPRRQHEGARHKDDSDGVEAIRAMLPPNARIGTGSVRRIAQLKALFPTARFENVRGNLDTRLRKLDAGEYDLLVLAAAGLHRLGFSSRLSATVPLEECVPAPGQGIIAIEIRSGDDSTGQTVAQINDADTWSALEAERALVVALGGGCQMPIGGIAIPIGAVDLELYALVASLDGARVIRYKKIGRRSSGTALGREVASYLLANGAESILDDARRLT